MRWFIRKWNKQKGQATTELAIMGTIVLMVLGFLLQQGFLYNNRQALEMYAFRQTLQLSQQNERGISLTVARDVFVPSFFTGLSRQRLMATSSVDYNPYILYIPNQDEDGDFADQPQDIPSLQLIQIGDAMIYQNSFFQVPPTKVKVTTSDSDEWTWVNSGVAGFSTEGEWAPLEADLEKYFAKTFSYTSYNYSTQGSETFTDKTITKNLQSSDTIPWEMGFEDSERIIKGYMDNDWKGEISSVEVDASTIPVDIGLVLQETVRRDKSVTTPH